MARLTRPQAPNPNPATKWLEWKSNNKGFSFYDKNLKEKLLKKGVSEEEIKKEKLADVPVELPFKFLFLEHYHKVTGWSDSEQSSINSNEVYGLGHEEMKVYAYGAPNEIAEGLYKNIKDKVKSAGGKYTRSIYGMLEDGSIINIQLKGSAVGGLSKEAAIEGEPVVGWSGFYRGDKSLKIKGHEHLLDNQWVEVNTAADGKKGAVKFSIPVFEIGKNISKKVNELANEAAKTLEDYMSDYFSKSDAKDAPVNEPELVAAGDVDDDLDDLNL